MSTVAVTGATGILGRALCARLQRHPAIGRIVGIARRPFEPEVHGWTKMEFRPADVLDPAALREALTGADVVCHLAFVVLDRGASADTVRRINVDGSANTFAAAADAGARRLVYASSIAAYGAHPDNPWPITEDHPTRGNTGFYYSAHKAAVERLLDGFAVDNPAVETTRLRPCVVVGPNSMELLRGPVPAALVGLALSAPIPWVLPDPGGAPMQFVHEDDVAEVFARAITAERVGRAYNLAGGGTMTMREVVREMGARPVAVPRRVLRHGAGLAARLRILPTGGEWIDMLAHPLVVDSARARRELGWVPAYDTRTALRDMLDGFRAARPLAVRRMVP